MALDKNREALYVSQRGTFMKLKSRPAEASARLPAHDNARVSHRSIDMKERKQAKTILKTREKSRKKSMHTNI